MPLSTEQIAQLEQRVAREVEQTTATRHCIHRRPELAGGEYETQTLVRDTLGAIGLPVQPQLLDTDVIAGIESFWFFLPFPRPTA